MAGLQWKVKYEGTRISTTGLVEQGVPIIRRVHGNLTSRIARLAKEKAPSDSGHLRSLIREDQAFFGGMLTMYGGVTSHADYSAAVHDGSRPHEIRAHGTGGLSFPWHGRQAFFRSVHHPGTKANPFLRDAAREALLADPDITVGG